MSAFDVFLDHERHLVLVTAVGQLTKQDGEEIISTARTLAAEYSYYLLYDIRQATLKIDLASWYNFPRKLEVYQNLKTRMIKAAVIASPDDKALEDYKFYEVVTANLGIRLRFFFDEHKAVEWLTENMLAKSGKHLT